MSRDHYVVPGFRAAAAAAGIKKHGGPDLGLIVSEAPAAAAGVFTTNRVRAAPVLLSREHIIKGRARAIIANAGCANACTGAAGLADARKTAEITAGAVNAAQEEVLVASTGVIGAPLAVENIAAALPGLVKGLSEEGLPAVAEAIMTTDKFSKLSRFDGVAGGRSYRIVGMAKGAGMIMPDMATMLSFILTDAAISPQDLKKAVSSAVEATFNRITVDGDTSTNDTVFVLANGGSGAGDLSGPGPADFSRGLRRVMRELALMIVKDGEGATRVILVRVQGAETVEEASAVAGTVANSNLVKTAVFGRDPNWGRIMAAVGRSGVSVEEERLDISINEIAVVRNGLGLGPEAEEHAARLMVSEETIHITINLNRGEYEDTIATCDLTHDYIAINADYRT